MMHRAICVMLAFGLASSRSPIPPRKNLSRINLIRGGAGEYSFSLTTFSPEGRLEQLEHALACVEGAPPVLAMCGDHCVVIVSTCPYLGPFVEESGTPKVMLVSATDVFGSSPAVLDEHATEDVGCIAVTFAGLGPDARRLASRAQEKAQRYASSLGEPMPGALVAAALAGLMQEATQASGGFRPFGASVLVASSVGSMATLFQVEPSGWWAPVRATAIGFGARRLLDKLSAKWRPGMSESELEDLGCELLSDLSPIENDSHQSTVPLDDGEDGQPRIDSSTKFSRRSWRGTGNLALSVLRTGELRPVHTTRAVKGT